MKVKELTLMALLSAILFLGQVILAPLPNFEIVSTLIVIYSVIFRWKALIMVYVFVLLEGVIYGFGLWWIAYLYIWTILVVLSIALSKFFRDNKWLWATFAGLYGLMFGSLTAIPYLFIGGPTLAVAYIISGFIFDVLHAAGNFVLVFLLFRVLKTMVTYLTKLFRV